MHTRITGFLHHSPVCDPASGSTPHAQRAEEECRSSFATPAESPERAPDTKQHAQPTIRHARAHERSSPPSWRLAALRFSQRKHLFPSPVSLARPSSKESNSPTNMERSLMMLLTDVDQDSPDAQDRVDVSQLCSQHSFDWSAAWRRCFSMPPTSLPTRRAAPH